MLSKTLHRSEPGQETSNTMTEERAAFVQLNGLCVELSCMSNLPIGHVKVGLVVECLAVVSARWGISCVSRFRQRRFLD